MIQILVKIGKGGPKAKITYGGPFGPEDAQVNTQIELNGVKQVTNANYDHPADALNAALKALVGI